MLAVLLLILKIIGISLLSILGFLILTILLVLFVPIRYRIVVKRTGLEGDPPADVRVSVTWLLHILNIHADYPAEIYLRARLFIFTLFRLPARNKAAQKKPKRQNRKKRKDEPEDGGADDAAQDEPKQETADSSAAETAAEESESCDAETDDQPQKKNILHTIRAFYDKIKGIILQIRDKLIHIRETVQSVKDNAAHYLDIMESRAFKESLNLAFGELGGVLKSIGPRKCRVRIEEGMDDPATTASVLAIYGMFYPWLYDKVTVVGNFDEQIIKADVFIKGRITAFRIAYAAVKIYFNKQVKTLIRMFKKEDKS